MLKPTFLRVCLIMWLVVLVLSGAGCGTETADRPSAGLRRCRH